MNEMSESKESLLITGQAGSRGIAVGDIYVIDTTIATVSPRQIEEDAVILHKQRFQNAKKELTDELVQMGRELNDRNSADIIEAQQQIVEDPEVEKKVYQIIEKKRLSVDFAVYQTFCEFIERLKESGSELFRQRIIDLEDIRDRLVRLVCDKREEQKAKEGSIIVTKEMSPTDLISYYENGIAGLVMEKGGVTSHAAIIAQSLGIPCVVSSKNALKAASEAKNAAIDGELGEVVFDPDSDTILRYRARQKALAADALQLKQQAEFETRDGFPFRLLANVEFEEEIDKAVESSPQGVGLLRTESLLFGRRFQKSFEEQVAFYTKMLKGIEGPATIRLFDVGGDKGSIRTNKEANPFLGWRGIRMLLDEREMLRKQLRAILKVAGSYPGRVKILVPMVSVIEEVGEIRKEMEQAQSDLLAGGINIDESVPLGLMVEVPSVALSAFEFAREVDFFSIGTNDLTQYTLAVDRGNEDICTLFQHYNPAVLKLIDMTHKAAREADIEVSVCGELAGLEIGAACIFGLGIHELSMNLHSIPRIKKLLSSYKKTDFEALGQDALRLTSAKEVQELFNDWKKR